MNGLLALAAALGTVAAVLLGASALGMGVLAWVPGDRRPPSATPVVGLAACVAWLGWVGLVVPPGSWAGAGSLVAVGVAALAAALAFRRDSLIRQFGEMQACVPVAVVGVASAAPFLVLIATSGTTTVVSVAAINDAYFFTAVPEWLRNHRLSEAPGLTADGLPTPMSPIGSTWDIYYDGWWRVGSETLTAAASRLLHADPVNLWLPITLTFAVLATVSVHGFVTALGRSSREALVVAFVVGVSAAQLDAIADQHTPHLLAMALAVALVSEVARGSAASAFVVALLAGGVAAVYGEMFALIGPAMLVWWIATSARSAWRGRARWLCRAVLWSVALFGTAWARLPIGATRGTVPAGYSSAFAPARGWSAVRSVAFGAAARTAGGLEGSWAAWAVGVGFLAAYLGGLAAVLILGPGRVWWRALTVVVVLGWIASGLHSRSGYPQHRFVQWSLSLLVIGAAIGCVALGARPRAGWRRKLGAWAAVVALAVPGVDRAMAVGQQSQFRVDSRFGQADSWLAERDVTGASTAVFASDGLVSLWTVYSLRSRYDAAFVSLYRQYVDLDHYGSLSDRRWLLLDRKAASSASWPAGALVEENGLFVLLDLSDGGAQVLVPPWRHSRWAHTGKDVVVEFADDGAVRCSAEADQFDC